MKTLFTIILLALAAIPSLADSLQQRVVALQLRRIELLYMGYDESGPRVQGVDAALRVLLKQPTSEDAEYYGLLKGKLPQLKASLTQSEAAGFDVNHPKSVALQRQIDFINEQLTKP